MIRLDRKVIEAVQAAAVREDLYPWLQNAIELEHSTIPPYLTAMFSLKPGTNDEIARLIGSIVHEEMLHMTIVGNILIAIGGHPAINVPRFIPKYPGHLPMAIGGSSFEVGNRGVLPAAGARYLHGNRKTRAPNSGQNA